MSDLLNKYDDLLKDTGPAAIVLKQSLMSIEGPEAVIFPPTYAAPKGDTDQKPRYNLDGIEGNKATACAIDSIGSQANRVEPLFKRDKYKHLVPQIVVTYSGGSTNLVDAGHRIADAIIRFSELLVEIHNAFTAYRDGNPEPMAKLAPTSLVFGAWDSRGTQIKIPRLINLRIDASDVEKRTRSAQYVPATDYVGNGLIDEVDENTGSDLGFAAVPASGQLGGVRAREIIVPAILTSRRYNLLETAQVPAICSDTSLDLRSFRSRRSRIPHSRCDKGANWSEIPNHQEHHLRQSSHPARPPIVPSLPGKRWSSPPKRQQYLKLVLPGRSHSTVLLLIGFVISGRPKPPRIS